MPSKKKTPIEPPPPAAIPDATPEASERAWVQDIYLQLREMLLEDRAPFITRFTGTDLIRLYPSSAATASDCLQWLANEGYLTFDEPFFYEVKQWRADEIQSLYNIRATLECLAASLAADRIGGRDLHLMKALHVRATKALRQNPVDGECFITTSRDFHLRVVAGSGNPDLVRAWEVGFVPALHRLACRAMTYEDMMFVLRTHENIIHAFECRDPKFAKALIEPLLLHAHRVLLDMTTGASLPPADRRWRMDFGQNPPPIEFGLGTPDAFGSVSSRVIKAARKRYWFDNPP